MLRSSFSLAWSSLGQLWKTRQPFSHKLLHSANQIEVLDKLLFSSLPAAIGGEKQPITRKQVQPQPFLYLPGMSQGAAAQMGPGEGRDGEAWMQTHQYAWRAPALPLLLIPLFISAKPYRPTK